MRLLIIARLNGCSLTVLILAKNIIWPKNMPANPGALTTEGGMMGFWAPKHSIKTNAAREMHDTANIAGILDGEPMPPSVVAHIKEVTEMKNALRPK